MRLFRRRPPAAEPDAAPTTRAEVDAWVARVAAKLPDGPVRDAWLDFPPGAPLAIEMEARLRMLHQVVAHLDAGGTVEAWDDLLR